MTCILQFPPSAPLFLFGYGPAHLGFIISLFLYPNLFLLHHWMLVPFWLYGS
jgi:hypothetical protein